MRLHRLKQLFVGTPLPTAQQRHERLGKATALAVFASDALSSVAYATEEILLVLVLAGTLALSYSLPIAERTRKLEEKWGKWGMGVPLIVLTSPYRSLLGPLLEYVDHLQQRDAEHVVTIVLPEFVPARWWQHLLHNQTALLIKGALFFRKNVIVTDVPYHLSH